MESLKSDDERMADEFEQQMVFVEGGVFMPGAKENKDDYAYTELTSFYISRYEITQAQWKAVMGTTIQQQRDKAVEFSQLSHGVGDNYPMYYVSWTEAKEFCEKLSEKTGKKYALPTEAQWEFAARGGNRSEGYDYSGSDNLEDVAWYDNNSGREIHAVGTKLPNELGIYDMSGNVCEWCADWYGEYSDEYVTNPTGPSTGRYRVLRGGDWDIDASGCHVSLRSYSYTDYRNNDLGFRIVMIP